MLLHTSPKSIIEGCGGVYNPVSSVQSNRVLTEHALYMFKVHCSKFKYYYPKFNLWIYLEDPNSNYIYDSRRYNSSLTYRILVQSLFCSITEFIIYVFNKCAQAENLVYDTTKGFYGVSTAYFNIHSDFKLSKFKGLFAEFSKYRNIFIHKVDITDKDLVDILYSIGGELYRILSDEDFCSMFIRFSENLNRPDIMEAISVNPAPSRAYRPLPNSSVWRSEDFN